MNYDLGGSLGTLALAKHRKSRAINAENPTGEKGGEPPGTIKERKPVPAGYTKRRDCDIGRNRRAGNHQSYMDYCD